MVQVKRIHVLEIERNDSREDRITQLKPPAPLYFEALDLADMLEEMEARSRIVHGFSNV